MSGNILPRLIFNRIIKYIVHVIYPESQCGSQFGHGTIDMISDLRQVAEKVRVRNNLLFMVCLDFAKACDTVNREVLCKVLKKLGVSDNMLTHYLISCRYAS